MSRAFCQEVVRSNILTDIFNKFLTYFAKVDIIGIHAYSVKKSKNNIWLAVCGSFAGQNCPGFIGTYAYSVKRSINLFHVLYLYTAQDIYRVFWRKRVRINIHGFVSKWKNRYKADFAAYKTEMKTGIPAERSDYSEIWNSFAERRS